MSPAGEVFASAVVLLRTAGGGLSGEELVAANVERMRPAEGVAETAREHFATAGFALGDTVGSAFSITAAPELFERHFGVVLERNLRGWAVKDGADALPVSGLPQDVAAAVAAVGLEGPPDFGPNSP